MDIEKKTPETKKRMRKIIGTTLSSAGTKTAREERTKPKPNDSNGIKTINIRSREKFPNTKGSLRNSVPAASIKAVTRICVADVTRVLATMTSNSVT